MVGAWWEWMMEITKSDLGIWFIIVFLCFVWGLITYYVDILRGKR